MEQFGRVSRVEGNLAIVAVEAAAGGCGRCDEAGGCRSGLLGQTFRKPCNEYAIQNSIGARQGDRVVVRVPPGRVFAVATLAYVVPLFGLFVGTLLGELITRSYLPSASGWVQVAGGLLGLGLAALLAVGIGRRKHGSAAPYLDWPTK